MSDVHKLLSAFTAGSLLRPAPDVTNIVDLGRALVMVAGAEGVRATAGSGVVADLIGPADHLVFILADGLGIGLVEELPGDSFLATHLVTELRTVFPSTTAVALTSIATGEWPSMHGVTGWWTHLPEIGSAAVILQFITRSDRRSLADLGVTVEQAFPIPSLMSSINRDTLVLFPERIVESVYSAYVSGNKPRSGYRSFRDAVNTIVSRVRHADRPTYTYLYSPRIDSVAHEHGMGHREVRSALLELDGELQRLREQLGERGRIVISADHGFLDTPQGSRHLIRASDSLMGLLKSPPSGDARVLYLHTRHGADARVIEHFRERFGERFLLITIDEAEGLELFGPGPLSPVAKSRLGDLIAISGGPDAVQFVSASGAGRMMSQASQHSGLTPLEMRVPLVIA